MKMKMRAILAMLLTLAALLSMFPAGAFAAETPELEWSLWVHRLPRPSRSWNGA